MNSKTIADNKHKELLSLVNPLVKFMSKNDFHFLLVAGKNGICARYLEGDLYDVSGMLTGLMKNNQKAEIMIQRSVLDLKKERSDKLKKERPSK